MSVNPFGLRELGPVRLATKPPQPTDPLPGFGAIVNSQPFLSLSSRVSSSEVFGVDGVVVIFVGYSSGQVRKVCIYSCVRGPIHVLYMSLLNT